VFLHRSGGSRPASLRADRRAIFGLARWAHANCLPVEEIAGTSPEWVDEKGRGAISLPGSRAAAYLGRDPVRETPLEIAEQPQRLVGKGNDGRSHLSHNATKHRGINSEKLTCSPKVMPLVS